MFVVRDEQAWFVPVETGIAGDRYFEVLSGIDAGALVAIGPFDAVRALEDGDPVRIDAEPDARR
ncbi:MAG: hypothetical protein F4Y57_04610 [Acidobacteria bacterium]|nr:hypothetical protein [Acidobacteriota bacterium]